MILGKIILGPFFVILLCTASMYAMELDDVSVDSDPMWQQQMQDCEEKGKEITRMQEELRKNYVQQKEKMARKRQKKMEEFDRRMQEENERHDQWKREMAEEELSIVRVLDDIRKESNQKISFVISELMKAHNTFMKEKQIPFSIRKKLVIESTIDDILIMFKMNEERIRNQK